MEEVMSLYRVRSVIEQEFYILSAKSSSILEREAVDAAVDYIEDSFIEPRVHLLEVTQLEQVDVSWKDTPPYGDNPEELTCREILEPRKNANVLCDPRQQKLPF